MDEKREEYQPHVRPGNRWIEARQRQPKEHFDRGFVLSVLGDNLGSGLSNYFPLFLNSGIGLPDGFFSSGASDNFRLNLTPEAVSLLDGMSVDHDRAFWHSISILRAPDYRTENAGALRQDWPRIPLPAKREDLEASAVLGRQLADLLDPEIPVEGVSTGQLRADLRPLGALSTTDKRPIDPEHGDLALTAGWGSAGKNGVTMPGKGKVVTRPDGALDIYLNERVYWASVPVAVWEYTLGGYQVIKKWLSYRERKLLGRDLKDDEARYVSEMVRRIAAILALGPELDANYERVKTDTYPWPAG